MTIIRANYFSKPLQRNVNYNAVIPEATQPLKTLYLLHGWSGNQDDWMNNTRIIEFAYKYQIAVVMPAGENKFYVDFEVEEAYGSAIAEDLINETRRVFPLSTKRADTWIAGLSMGGYGSLAIGLKHANIFGKIAAMSSRLIASGIDDFDYNDIDSLPPTIKLVYRHKKILGTEQELDLKYLVEHCQQLPQIALYCGTEDSFIEENQQFYEWLYAKDSRTTFCKTSGGHDWDYWNKVIEPVIVNLLAAS